jgi:hypothetical protein
MSMEGILNPLRILLVDGPVEGYLYILMRSRWDRSTIGSLLAQVNVHGYESQVRTKGQRGRFRSGRSTEDGLILMESEA